MMLCALCDALLTDAEIERCDEERMAVYMCFDCLEEEEEDE